LIFAVLVGVVLAGALFGVRAAATTSLAVALTVAILVAFQSGALIAGVSEATALVLIKLQLGTFAMAGMLVAAESHERELATEMFTRSESEGAAVERERQRERDLAIHVQRGLLPDRIHQAPGIAIAARYEAASEALVVGGDWYDSIALSGGRVGLVIGDIVGHGIDAMTSMGRLRTAVLALAMNNDGPAQTLTAVDQFVATPDGTGYATVFYAIVDPLQRAIQYGSAGHPPALLLSPNGDARWLDAAQSQPLSGNDYGARPEAGIDYEPGSILVMYSDGLVERRGESLTTGLERLELLARSLSGESAQAICDGLFNGLAERERTDDVVVMVMRSQTELSTPYHETFPARPEELRNARSSLRKWMESQDLSSDVKDDLLIATGEVAANSVRHAYRDSPTGDFDIHVEHVKDKLVAKVADKGTWRIRDPGADSPGLGLGVVRSITQGLSIEKTGHGTHVTFEVPIPCTPRP
jgi:serine phosphatase RsbU (regulator of sigma subunit)/anti-sigma regulatory factor (Ser/Thr protein kinase)